MARRCTNSTKATLKRIKEFEGNRAVLSQVLFWANLLRQNADLFTRKQLFLNSAILCPFLSTSVSLIPHGAHHVNPVIQRILLTSSLTWV